MDKIEEMEELLMGLAELFHLSTIQVARCLLEKDINNLTQFKDWLFHVK